MAASGKTRCLRLIAPQSRIPARYRTPSTRPVSFRGDASESTPSAALTVRTDGALAKEADIPTTLGRFKINGVLGSGGYGRVYLGFDERLQRNVAIKVPTRALVGTELDRFLEEARRLAQLRHPGIVTVL